MGRKLCVIVIAVALTAGTFASIWGSQEEKTVEVALPGFQVTLNGVKVDNDFKQYPLIVYKDITYFPMTYQDARFLGVESYWKGSAEGLFIEATDITAAYPPDKALKRNSQWYTATIPSFPIQVNGRVVDNGEAEYPLLSFRNITYFPMTWEYSVNEFGWDYSFDSHEGLVVNAGNIKQTQIEISGNRAKTETGMLSDSVTVANGYVYYEGTEGKIMQAPLSDPAQSKFVYQLPIWTYGDGKTYVYENLYAKDGKAFVFYHQGGATMGTDYLIQLNQDGSATELNNTRNIINTFGDKTFKYWGGPAPGPGNLSMKTGDSEFKAIGSPDYLYGWSWHTNSNSSGGSGVDDVYFAEEDLYILAYPMGGEAMEDNPTTGIHKVNIHTNEVIRLSEREVVAFQLEGDTLYYPSEGSMYKLSLEDGKEAWIAKLTDEPDGIGDFAVINRNIYWQNEKDRNLYKVGQEKSVNQDALLNDMILGGDHNEYLICTFEETPQSKYRIMIFDQEGEVVFKSSDKASVRNISIEGKTLFYYNVTTETVSVASLK